MAERFVPVVHKSERRLMKVDLSSVESLTNDISRRLKIHDIKLFGKRRESEEYCNIKEDEDLEGFQEMAGLVLLAKTASETDCGTRGGPDHDVGFADPMFNPRYHMPTGEGPPFYMYAESQQQDLLSVVIDEETYTLKEIPARHSDIVVKMTQQLKGETRLTDISSIFKEVQRYLQLAYYASLENEDLHMKIQNMQLDVEELCMRCDSTILKIKLSAGEVVDEMQSGFGYILDNFEKIGLKRLSDVSTIAAKVQEDAKELVTLSADLRYKIKMNFGLGGGKVLDEVTLEKRTKNEEVLKGRSLFVTQSQAHIKYCQEQELAAEQAKRGDHKSDSGFGFAFKSLISLGLCEGNKASAEHQKQLADKMKQEREKEMERLKQLQNDELEVKVELEQLNIQIVGRMADMTGLSRVAIQAANFGIKLIQSFLMSMVEFWAKSKGEFLSFDNSKFIDDLMLVEPEKRREFWTTQPFKYQAIKYIAAFVAVQVMCKEFQHTMKEVSDDIHSCIKDNPTREDAKKKLPLIMEKLTQEREAKILADAKKSVGKGSL